jgi:pimeloyl-ACP methyl ester carboxylesterase
MPVAARTLVTRAGDLTVVGHASPPPPGEHRSVVLVHGVGSSARAFRRLVEHLAPHAAVHALDLPGFGDAPHPHHDVTIAEHTDVVARYVAEHVTGAGLAPPVVVGHSMGTQVAGQLLADHPDVAAGAVLLGPTADPRARSIPRQAARLALDALGERPRAMAVLLHDVVVRCGLPYYLGQLRHVVRHRLEDVLPRTDAPVVVVRGRHDPVAPPAWSERLAALAPRGTLRTVAGGHHAMDADPQGLADVALEAWELAARGAP